MRELLERYVISSTPAWRVLLAVFVATPFFLIVLIGHAYAMERPDIREGLRISVMWVLQVTLVLATATTVGTGVWLWPRRRAVEAVPRATLLVCLAIGICYTTITVATGTFTAPGGLVLLGVLAVGLLLFKLRPMLISYVVCVSLIVLQDTGVLLGLLPYAPALREGVMDGTEPVWWFLVWRQFVSVAGYSVLLGLVFLLFERLDVLHAELRRLSFTDGLTGLANRRRTMEVLRNELARQRRTGQSMVFVLIDADHFKAVNDVHGHAMGDRVLRKLGLLLMGCVRSPTDVACRLGGEEFALILPHTNLEQVRTVCERLRETLARETFGEGEQAFKVTLSMGIVEGRGQDVERILQEADQQLYLAKSGGRDRVCVAEPRGARR